VLAIVVLCQIKPERVADFIEASLDDARHSVIDEPGCVRFDVVQDNDDATKIWLYEIYRDQAAFDHHLTTPHYHRWNGKVREWMSVPAQVARCTPVFLTEEA
jgi:autoinducer 2-degrading protein